MDVPNAGPCKHCGAPYAYESTIAILTRERDEARELLKEAVTSGDNVAQGLREALAEVERLTSLLREVLNPVPSDYRAGRGRRRCVNPAHDVDTAAVEASAT